MLRIIAFLTFLVAMVPTCAFAQTANPTVVSRQQLCDTLNPAASVNGRVVSLTIRYCGEFIALSDGRSGYEYQALMDGNGRARPIWPSHGLVQFANNRIENLRRARSEQGMSNIAPTECFQITAQSEFAGACRQLLLVSRNFSAAQILLAQSGDPEDKVDQAVAVVLSTQVDGLSWKVPKAQVEALLAPLIRSGNRSAIAMSSWMNP